METMKHESYLVPASSNDRVQSPVPQTESGAVLIVALIMLVMLGVIAMTGMNQVIMEQRVVQNMDEHNRKFQTADSALKWCEEQMFDGRTVAPEPLDLGFSQLMPPEDDPASPVHVWREASGVWAWWQAESFWTANALTVTEAAIRSAGIASPLCIRQEVATEANETNKMAGQANSSRIRKNGMRRYKITSYAIDDNARSAVILESDYFARYE
jgi:type IV pilus assembly protein PilX